MTTMDTLSHWRLDREPDGLARLTFDRAGSAVNALSADTMAELAVVLDALDAAPPAGLIIQSGKSTGFIVGADVNEFASLDTPEQARGLIARGWNLFNRLAAVRYPTLALIQGHCLGGGLELALACRYRLVADQPGTSLALPEVMLGIFPGWGGMLRLPKLIGAPAALDMMLTGRGADARRAAALGLADARVPPRLLQAAARQLVLSKKPPRRARGVGALANLWPFKLLVAKRARKQIAAKDPLGHYPAAPAIVTLWEKHGGNALQAPDLIDAIISSDTARNLLRVFRLQERLKANGKQTSVMPARHVHVVGAGTMGGDIAAWCAYKGLTVTLQDQDMARIAPAIGRAAALYARRLKDPRLARAALDRLIPDPDGGGVPRADIIIEAISEQPEAKRALYQALEPRMKADALLATNTSSLSLETLRSGLARPERLVGIHFFNPVAKMPLVEVVHAEGDADEATARACAFVGQIDKLALPVKSAPGFLVNAVLAPYMLQAMRSVDEGMSPETVDAAMVAFGMPMGPLELADTVGLDIARAAGEELAGGAEPPRCLAERLARGELGKKSGKGFYTWRDGKPVRQGKSGESHATAPAGLAQRLIQPLVDATQGRVQSGVVADADSADAGVIFGTGFAPFTGGPLHYQASNAWRSSKPAQAD
ncbi:3-hydroxyacyl-CoA dehydrogenase NAD-binding domain-containing protein [Achromobacter piechaudii]|uniref:Fatty acid oxidation complex subunit alpha n=1 Tax=Achromobacter piechaudii TaxID=72556 RepID=A0ABN7EZM4_9BURK|nr:3-hydroxyacyl-CoA dehydrogenase NAD-binding domain-containing protein [Achromobacter piechaudii]CAB3702838.1 Fatty acid oxidation complex subunit alpha [Achromobacter piechaudii]CAB3849510.1 Fatty acid oxidation complex subunit alpha [Achromobacter piechaudii]CAB3951173.1 Fatty acid oxidation complex subunit alpha [Achromobacter piechaudii]